jgi:hypothetical protein
MEWYSSNEVEHRALFLAVLFYQVHNSKQWTLCKPQATALKITNALHPGGDSNPSMDMWPEIQKAKAKHQSIFLK